MKIRILCDIHWESKIDRVIHELSDLELRQYFENQYYGDGLTSLSIIFMCREPELNFKRRIRHSKKERKIHLDIMLDFNAMKIATPEARKQEVAQRLWDEVPEVLSRYKLPDFDKERFIQDLRELDRPHWLEINVKRPNYHRMKFPN